MAAPYDFTRRTALVTGGAGGIGAAAAQTLLSGGARVATLDSRAADLEGVLAIDGDVRRSEDVDAAVARVAAEIGPLDIAVCAAGVSGESLATVDVGDEEWHRVFSINCHGVFFTNRAAARVMVPRGYGRIVNVASIAGKEGNPTASAYSASKAAVIGLTKSLGKELAKTGIRVNCITPAAVRTPIFDQITQAHIDFMLSKIPVGRFGTVDEIAAMICWLCSEEASFSTASVFDCSGGRATY